MATKADIKMPRFKTQYETSSRKALQEKLQLANLHEVPRIRKIVVSVGLGRGKDDKRLFEVAGNTLRRITGQQPVETFAKKSIANFKIREGLSKIGLKVTLRDKMMYEFLDRLITVVLPRVRDFHGVSTKSFDGQGNYSIGFKDQSVFPELSYEETTVLHGLQITIVIDSRNNDDSLALLESFGMPFEKRQEKRSA